MIKYMVCKLKTPLIIYSNAKDKDTLKTWLLENIKKCATYYMQHNKLDNLMTVPINLKSQYQKRL